MELLGSLNKPIFAWSGGNPGVTAAINAIRLRGCQRADQCPQGQQVVSSRDNAVPHNLYAQGSGLFTMAPEGATPPPQQFEYRKARRRAAGDPSPGWNWRWTASTSRWTFDPKSGNYLRFQGGKAHNDAALGQVNADNVVVLVVDYVQSKIYAPSPVAQTTRYRRGLFVFSDGKVVHGTWTRDDRLKPFALTADDGTPILLTPGRTWVELARVDSTTPHLPDLGMSRSNWWPEHQS